MTESDPEKLADKTVLRESDTQAESQDGLSTAESGKSTFPGRTEIASASSSHSSRRKTTASRDFNTIDTDTPFVHFTTAAVLLALCIAVCVSFITSTYAWPTKLSWPVAEGQVTKIEVRGKRAARFYYDYSVGKSQFKGMNLKSDSLEHTVQVGKRVRVRYKPDNFNESVMEGGFNALETPFYVIVCIGLFLAFIHFLGKGVKKLRTL